MARINVALLRSLAQRQGYTAASLSRAADLGYSTVYKVWDGSTPKPNLQTIEAIARALGVRTVDLIIEDDTSDQQNPRTRSGVATSSCGGSVGRSAPDGSDAERSDRGGRAPLSSYQDSPGARSRPAEADDRPAEADDRPAEAAAA